MGVGSTTNQMIYFKQKTCEITQICEFNWWFKHLCGLETTNMRWVFSEKKPSSSPLRPSALTGARWFGLGCCESMRDASTTGG